MRLLFLSLFFFSTTSFANEVLLHCDMTWTDLKSVQIEKRDNLYVLIEHKLKNRIEEKAITEREYLSQSYRLSNYAYYFRRLEKVAGDWYLIAYGPGEEQIGQVTCTE